jgi:AbrB family looped-hinge helix DNA binding protein
MKSVTSTITGKGQITIPSAVREHLGVGTHDKITFVLEVDGSVSLTRQRFPNVASLRGIAGILQEPMGWDEVEQIAHDDYVLEEYGRDE